MVKSKVRQTTSRLSIRYKHVLFFFHLLETESGRSESHESEARGLSKVHVIWWLHFCIQNVKSCVAIGSAVSRTSALMHSVQHCAMNIAFSRYSQALVSLHPAWCEFHDKKEQLLLVLKPYCKKQPGKGRSFQNQVDIARHGIGYRSHCSGKNKYRREDLFWLTVWRHSTSWWGRHDRSNMTQLVTPHLQQKQRETNADSRFLPHLI